MGVKVNGEESDFFINNRQGDPLSPLLFNLVVDVFVRMLVKGGQVGLIKGLCQKNVMVRWFVYNMQMTLYCSWIMIRELLLISNGS